MKAFRFRAQAILDLRTRHRDAIQTELAQAERAEHEASAAVEHADRRLQRAGADGADALRAGGPITKFERHRNWIAHLRDEGDRLCRVRQERAAEVSRVRERLRVAHQQVRVLERLRDQMSQRHATAVRHEEMRELDEIATLRFSRQQSQGRSARGS
ncbi:MAG: flagellar export protein FliJ [Acidobacteria bacterium]|nr:flagellar export protein FliJ [Acidobacteriota bacterium]